MNIVYMGTPDFAVKPLEKIINERHNVLGVFTQPDKPKGRGYSVTPPPVKECALKHGIPVYQPVSMKNGEAFEILSELKPDVIVVVAYGKILPKNILELPKYGCINAEGLDTGDMLFKSETQIGENETASELHDRLSVMGAELIVKTLTAVENNTLVPQKQNDEESSYAPMLTNSASAVGSPLPLIPSQSSSPCSSTAKASIPLRLYFTGSVCGVMGRGKPVCWRPS